MGRPSRFSPEVWERALRMVWAHAPEHPSQWATIEALAPKLGCTGETLRPWVRQAERDTGRRADLEGKLVTAVVHPPEFFCAAILAYAASFGAVFSQPLGVLRTADTG